MKEPKWYDFRQDGYTLQVLQTDSKYNSFAPLQMTAPNFA